MIQGRRTGVRCAGGALLACIALIGAGCAVGPRYVKPAAPEAAGFAPDPLPEHTAGADVHGGEEQHFVAAQEIPFAWWELFQAPQLDSLIRRVLRANPNIAAAQAALVQARELVAAQQGFYFPTIGATYQLERHKIAGNLTNDQAPGVQGNGDNLLAPLQDPTHYPYTAPLYYSFQTAELTVGFVPDVFGANRRQVESMEAQAEEQRFALEATVVTLAVNTAAAAIQEASLRGQLRATRDIIDADARMLQILQDQFRLGLVMRMDVAAQEAVLAQARATLPPLELQLLQTRDLIRALAGNLPNEDVAETFELDGLQLPQVLPVSLPARIVAQRPDVRAAEAALHSANAQVGVAIAAMLPQFPITGSYGGNADQFAWMFRSGGPFWNLVGDVTQPLFQGGTLLHRERAAKAALRQAAALYQAAVLTACQNVADTLHALQTDAEALTAAVQAETAAKITYDLTIAQLRAGYVAPQTVLAVEVSYQQALLGRIQAQAARYTDTAALFQALGGGWWNRDGGTRDGDAARTEAGDDQAPSAGSASIASR